MKFTATKEEFDTIGKIMKRALKHTDREPVNIMLDLEVCHSNGTPLDFDKLLAFDDCNFLHDINGIARHIDRNTGELKDCFLPRCGK